ncbi:tripartite tricarboxylate transporter TctB family protein [Sandarakinorhabdus sp.]|uniref:tripartite tricarboxylate transporter TctB family protein n=1 Tax=Sandarakinorhabdus sp. TaxID=1916663 RepID=UPI003F7098C8
MKDDTVSERMFNLQLNTRRLYVIGGIVVLLLGAFGLGITISLGDGPEAFQFIGLLIIAMAGLATTAAVFTGLRMGTRQEAFGLPNGSIRAILAIGIMVLFVVFALPVADPGHNRDQRVSDTPIIANVEVSVGKLPDEVERYKNDTLTVFVHDYGRAAQIDPNGIVIVPERPARISVYSKTTAQTREAAEASKQLITALVTLLTSIVSFYFGSKSVVDATRDPIAPTGPSEATVNLRLGSKKIFDELGVLSAEEAAWQSAIGATEVLVPPTNTEELAQFTRNIDTARANFAAYVVARDAVRAALAQVDQALEAVRNDNDARTRVVKEAEAKRFLDSANGDIVKMRDAAEATRAAVSRLTPVEG